jgi:hypothetical protein
MIPVADPFTISIPLGLSAHANADRFRRCHTNPQAAKRVYLNTLAVYAVQVYLDRLGFDLDLAASASQNPALQALMDSADLVVQGCGTLECRPVVPNESVMRVPPEVQGDRVGYVAVQLNESLKEATLLGYHAEAEIALPLHQLRSIEDLAEHLIQNQQMSAQTIPSPTDWVINAAAWLGDRLDAVAQALSWQLFTPALGFRSQGQPLALAGLAIPPEARGVTHEFTVDEVHLQIQALTWLLELPDHTPGWTLLLLLQGQDGDALPEGTRLQVYERAQLVDESVVPLGSGSGSKDELRNQSEHGSLYTQVAGRFDEQFQVSIQFANGAEFRLPLFTFSSDAVP